MVSEEGRERRGRLNEPENERYVRGGRSGRDWSNEYPKLR